MGQLPGHSYRESYTRGFPGSPTENGLLCRRSPEKDYMHSRILVPVLFLLLLGSPTAHLKAAPEVSITADTVARYISGLPVEDDALPSSLRNLAAFKAQRQFFESRWSELEPQRLDPMRSWANSELKQAREDAETVFYPFGGPDFLHAFTFFPNANRYIHFGLEPAGVMPDLLTMTQKETADMLLLQKKRFSFRRWNGEIGGDFCSTHTIELRGRRCIVFLNGDAMGKSLQGAAGALILGSVFESIIQRTELSQEIQTLYPEMWLRDAYLELQKIFCTFDGYMMASMVLGVVEEDSGLMYFLNAEHPWPVLYRNSTATFPVVEQDRIIHKLGIPHSEKNLRIYTLQLLPGDVFISGSDGRDDLIIGADSEGNRIYNMDESAFLSVVEQSKGHLPAIQDNLQQRGQISDDLSLLRIELQGQQAIPRVEISNQELALKANDPSSYESAINERISDLQRSGEPVPADLYRELFEISFRNQDYEKAARISDEWLLRQNGDTRYLYLSSYALKRSQRIEEARIQAERVLLRDPHHANNLVNLADIYRMLGLVDKAENCIERALEFRPGHKSAELIKKALSELRAEL